MVHALKFSVFIISGPLCLCVTQKVKASRYPRWNETFEFDLANGEGESGTVSIKVWDWDRVGEDDFMGQVTLCIAGINCRVLLIFIYYSLLAFHKVCL